MYPAKWFFRKHEQEPTTEVAIRRTFAEDLYLVMPAFELQDQSAGLEIVVNPLVNWVWVGFGILALGTGIALLPDTVFAFAIARVPANAAAAFASLAVPLVVARGRHRAERRECRSHGAQRRFTDGSKPKSCVPAGAGLRWAVVPCGPTAGTTTRKRPS